MSLGDLVTALEELPRDDRGATRQFQTDFDKKKVKEIISTVKDDDWESIQRLLVACLRYGDRPPMDCACAVLDKRNILDWKKHSSIRTEIFNVLLTEVVDLDRRDGDYHDFIEKFVKILKTQRLLTEHEDDMMKLMHKVLSYRKCPLHIGIHMVSLAFPWKAKESYVTSMLDTMYTSVHNWPDLSEDEKDVHLHSAFNATLLAITTSLTLGTIPPSVVTSLVREMEFCMDQEWQSESNPDKHTLSYQLIKDGLNFASMNSHHAEVLKPMIPIVKKLWDCSDEDLQRDANHIMTSLGNKASLLEGDDHETLIQMYLTGQQTTVVGQFSTMYPSCPEVFHAHLDEIVDSMPSLQSHMKSCIIALLWEIAKIHPEVLTTNAIQVIIDALGDPTTRLLGLTILISLVDKRSDDVAQHDDVIIKAITADDMAATQGCVIIGKMSHLSEEHARRYMKVIMDRVYTINTQFQGSILASTRVIGQNYLDVLAERKDEIVKLREKSGLGDICQGLLDMIEGRSLATVTNEIADQREELDHLDQRVVGTEENVDNLGQVVENQGEQLGQVTEDVDQQHARVDDLEQAAEQTAERVQELEHRTLSHAPEWSHDVCKLLNPKTDQDWRLLAGRLGYSNDDIRNWATQADPCMSMLDEWFASQKTREATHAVLTNLQEMNRDDAATIVKEALKAVDDVIADAPEDYAHPPPVFISYQWGVQQEVRLLKKHLGMAGYQAWMDIGQMGGGDKLYEKIDKGIRAAQVVICCVTDKYALSPNCNREVALCVNLGKPIIPLLMEPMSWPPAGAMGPIFGEYIYIRCFQDKKADDGDPRFWKEAKFQELLMQLRYSIPPDQSVVVDPYLGWWDPPEEEIIIKPRKIDGKEAEKTTPQKVDDEQTPEVFISYQWDKQPQIKALYRRLSGVGYHCWLDIMQMGGGDSLYDKIDRGIRGCRVVVSCVTSKYAKSANCRREVSLADATRKPIIPLLLEDITWPPEGPMGLVFTQMLYVSFCHPGTEVQNHWECPAFDQLLGKIGEHAPKTLCDDQDGEKNQNKDTGDKKVVQSKPPGSAGQKSKSAASLRSGGKSSKSSACSIV